MLNNKIVRNASWIIACRVAQALFNLAVTMLTARYLGPSGYGVVNYAASIVAFAVPVMQLGLNAVLVQEMIAAPEEEGRTLGTAITMSLFSALLSILGVVAFSAVANPAEPDTILICGLYSLLLVFQAFEHIQYWFQAKYLSKYTSLVVLAAYAVASAYKIYLLVAQKSVVWFALSQALDYLVIAIGFLIVYRRFGTQRLAFSRHAAARMLAKSRYYIVSALMITVFAQTDRIMLKLMVGDASVGYYSAAVTCAGMTGFVFAAVIDSVRPSIFEAKKISREAYEGRVRLLYSLIVYAALLQCVAVTLLSGWVIDLLYGADYGPAVDALRIVVWYTAFSYIGPVRSIWMLAEGKQKYLWIVNLSGAILNVALNFVLIPHLGLLGAAWASLATQIFANFLIGFILRPIRENNRLLLGALNPKTLLQALR